MDRRLALVLLLLATFAGGHRSLKIGYLSDDWAIISHVSRHGNASAWTGPWLGMTTLRFHRPIFTGLYHLEYELFGADPRPAHLHHLAWHLVATGLLFVFLTQLGLSTSGAFLGALIFSHHPYLPGATGWLAGRCGTVAGTLTLLTLVAFVRGRRNTGVRAAAWQALALLAAAGASLTRESGYLALIAPLSVDLVLDVRRPSPGRLLRTHAPFALAGFFLLALRFSALGTVGGGYPEPDGLMAGPEGWGGAFKDGGQALLRLVGGVPPEALGGSLLLPACIGVATTGVLLAGLRRSVRASSSSLRAALLLLLLLGTQLALLLVAGPTLAPSTGQRWYAAVAFFAALLGLASTPFLERSHLWAPVLLLPGLLAGHLVVQGKLLQADQGTQAVVSSALEAIRLEEAGRQKWVPPQPLDPIMISCLPESHLGLPTFQWGFSEALRPPFQEADPPAPVYPIHRFMFLRRHPTYPYHPPVEALLQAQGRHPFALALEGTADKPAFTVARADVAQALLALGPHPAAWPFFAGESLKILQPADAGSGPILRRGRPLEVHLVVAAGPATKVEFFAFLPTVDMRIEVPIHGPLAEADLGPKLEDYARFRNEQVDLYVVPVGYDPERPETPLLGDVVTFRITP